jgi:carboxymethylenebutenolidase
MKSSASTLTRRDAVARGVTTTAGVGYALAVSPVTAWAITTPATDLDVRDVKIPTGAGGKEAMPAYVAAPKGKSQLPVVLVVHEIFGVHEYIKDVCRRLAKAGYVALAPDLFFRHGDATKITNMTELRTKIVSKADQATVLADLDAARAWLKADGKGDLSRAAITGFCWGGNVVWMYAAHEPSLKAGVAWYGRWRTDGAKAPLDIAASLTVPVLGLYGGKDKGIPQTDVEAMRKELAKGKTGSKIHVFPDAEHAFHADYRPSYHEKAAQEGWQELLAWLKGHGVV